jgi:NAD(P)-dependent dehydrogenase (short-subunit alcohol dehydrogenase family)
MPAVIVTGANRGIGLEFARQYAKDGWQVIATVRDPAEASELRGVGGEVRIEQLEMADHAALARFPERLGDQPIDLLICNAGMSGPRGGTHDLEPGGWLTTLAVNAVAPTVLAAALVPNVEAARGKMIAISSRMGSIADNQSGGYVAYRTSKAALKAAWRSVALDLRDRPVSIAMFHPGWVQTDMGGPNAQISPEQSVSSMRKVIETLDRDRSGSFFNYDGTVIPW